VIVAKIGRVGRGCYEDPWEETAFVEFFSVSLETLERPHHNRRYEQHTGLCVTLASLHGDAIILQHDDVMAISGHQMMRTQFPVPQ